MDLQILKKEDYWEGGNEDDKTDGTVTTVT